MNKIQLDALFLCLVLLGMITLLPLNQWKHAPKKETTMLVCQMVVYFLIVLFWGYQSFWGPVLIGTVAIGRMFSLIFVVVRGEGYNILLPLMVNFVVNFGLLFLASFQRL